MNLNKSYLNFCKKNNFEINTNQFNLVKELNNFLIYQLLLVDMYLFLNYSFYKNFGKDYLNSFFCFKINTIF